MRSSAATPLRLEDIHFDCRLYNGYKPCTHGNHCPGCPHYEPLTKNDRPLAWKNEKVTPSPDGTTRILLIKTGAMGDVLRTTTLLPGLKRVYPNSHLTWLTDPAARPLLCAAPQIDELLGLDDATAEALSRREFDVLINLEKEKQPLVLAGEIAATVRLGYAPTPWGTPTVFNRESEYALILGINDDLKFRGNCKSYPAIIAEMAALPYQRDPYVLGLTEASRARLGEIEQQLSSGASSKRRPRIGLNTGCGNAFRTKQWPIERWTELARFLRENTSADLLLMGGRAERELNAGILAAVPGLVDTGTENDLEQFLGVVDACDLVVTSDTLGMHIAIALQKYVVGLFGSTSHVEIDLFDRGEKVITDFPCSPCYLKTCNLDPMCMQAMSGTHVGGAVLRGLGQLAGGAVAG